MNIIEKIKNILLRKNQKLLPEPQEKENQNYKNNQNKKNKKWLLSKNNNYSEPTKLENEIDKFLLGYYNQVCQFENQNTCEGLAYNALISMNARPVTQDEYYKNSHDESVMLGSLFNGNRYGVEIQKLNGQDIFYHIKSNGYQMPDFENMRRIYIDCNNGNIAELSNLLLDYNQNPNFYMKFTANHVNAQNPRNEKIVIYCDKNDFKYTQNLIRYTKQIRPDLYKESEYTMPFMQSVDNTFSVSKQPYSNQYNDLYGTQRGISQSTNKFIANILKDSYLEAAREISRVDPNLDFFNDNSNFYNEALYVKNYPYINENYHQYLVDSMKAKMEVLSQKNDVYIEGVNNIVTERQNDEIQNDYER